jgi:hypothetical protein
MSLLSEMRQIALRPLRTDWRLDECVCDGKTHPEHAKTEKKAKKKMGPPKSERYHDHDLDDSAERSGTVISEMQRLLGDGEVGPAAEMFALINGIDGLDESTEVADTIAAQMGGIGRIRMMLGAKKIVALDNGLAITWPNKERSKGNHVEITLRADDTYDMEFFNVAKGGKKSTKKYEMIYADQLTGLFRDWTGWALRL